MTIAQQKALATLAAKVGVRQRSHVARRKYTQTYGHLRFEAERASARFVFIYHDKESVTYH
jgi:hypothetical protein